MLVTMMHQYVLAFGVRHCKSLGPFLWCSLTVSNGSFSGTASSMGLGLGPSAETSGCSEVAWSWRWFWPLITAHLLMVISQIVSDSSRK